MVGAAQNAAHAEQRAQAAASKGDQQRAALSRIPLPTKSLYVDVHEPGAWANPFLSVNADSLNLRVTMADANPSPVGAGTMLRPEAARRQEVELRPGDLADALIAARRMALRPRDCHRRVAAGQPQRSAQGSPQR